MADKSADYAIIRRALSPLHPRTGCNPLSVENRDRLGSEALPYLSLVRRGLRYSARSDSLMSPSAEMLLGLEGFAQPDLREQLGRMRLALLTARSPIESPHPEALLAFGHTRTVLYLLPIVGPRLLPHWPTSAGLGAPRSGVELTNRVFELETSVSRLAAGLDLARGETRRTMAFFEVAALRPEQLAPVLAEMS